uniref:Secreted protein n=1 Tax=Syphacia muris TaxID=451379 RepID=A0A0N5AGI3_9BILA
MCSFACTSSSNSLLDVALFLFIIQEKEKEGERGRKTEGTIANIRNTIDTCMVLIESRCLKLSIDSESSSALNS